MFGINKKSVVDKDFIHALNAEVQDRSFTHDRYLLEQRPSSWLFVADEMMRECREATLLPEDMANRYGVAFTQQKYIMFKKDLGKRTYPVILPIPASEHFGSWFTDSDKAVVRGELYEVNNNHLMELDKWKQNGKLFSRTRVKLDIPYRKRRVYRSDNLIHILSDPNIPGPQTIVGLRNMGRSNNFVIDAEWEHFRMLDAFMYIARPEHFLWENFADRDTFKQVKLTIPNDNNLEPYYHYTSREDQK